ncbi:MAG: DUF167 domain-containing protein [Telmatospirillum sp.]|nr:DUF167 domain-containing protein [Telmatospirillum sp.]
MLDGPLAAAAGGCRRAVKVTPKASRDRSEGVAADADGNRFLKISVTAVPEDGKANKAVIALLAKRLKLAKRSISVLAGATDRRKVLFIEGEADALAHLLLDCMRST